MVSVSFLVFHAVCILGFLVLFPIDQLARFLEWRVRYFANPDCSLDVLNSVYVIVFILRSTIDRAKEIHDSLYLKSQ